MNSLLWMLTTADSGSSGSFLEGDDVTKLWGELYPLLTTIVWLIVAVLGVVLVIKGVTTALAVVKAADEPQVRQEKIASFKYMAIGLGIALVITTIMATVLSIFKNKFLDNLNATEPTSFLF